MALLWGKEKCHSGDHTMVITIRKREGSHWTQRRGKYFYWFWAYLWRTSWEGRGLGFLDFHYCPSLLVANGHRQLREREQIGRQSFLANRIAKRVRLEIDQWLRCGCRAWWGVAVFSKWKHPLLESKTRFTRARKLTRCIRLRELRRFPDSQGPSIRLYHQ